MKIERILAFFGMITICLLIIVLLLHKGCNSPEPSKPEITIKETIKYITDTIQTETVRYKTIKVKESVFVPVPAIIDTNTILQAYYTKNYYQDTLQNDTNLLAIVSDTIFQDKILSRQFYSKIFRTTKIITDSVFIKSDNPNKINLLAGGVIGGNKTSFEVSPTIALQLKNNAVIQVGYGFPSKQIKVGLLLKLKNPFSK